MYDLFILLYPWYLVGHIVSVVAWMAGIFYLPRLFVYHSEEVSKNSKTPSTICKNGRSFIECNNGPSNDKFLVFWSLSFYCSWSCGLGSFLAMDKIVQCFTTYNFSLLA